MGKSHDLATLKGGGTIDGEIDVTSGGYTARGLALPDVGTSIGSMQLGYDGSNGVVRTWMSSPIKYQTYGTHQFETTGTTRMTIDASGRVTMPYQPAFRAKSTNTGWTTLTANTWVTAALETEEYDQGSNYNTTNYRFTAPIAGLYQLTLLIYARIQNGGRTSSSNYWSARFGKNGNTQGGHCIVGYFSDGEWDNTCTLTSTLDLSANDYIEVYVRGHGYNAEYYRANCRFEGRLVG